MTPEHLDDDALSALLDGEATLEEAAHAEDCAVCSGRSGELRRAANLIGGPVVPVDEEQRNAAITAALDAQVISLDAVRRRRTPPGWIVGAAAVVLLGLGLVPVLNRDSDRDQQSTATGAARDAPAQETAGAGESDAMMSAPAAPGPVDAGDLGPLDGEREVQRQVTAALRNASPGPSPTAGTTGDGGGGGAAGGSDEDGAAALRSGAPCEEQLRSSDPLLGALRLIGRASVDGRPAQLLVFDVAGDDRPALRAYVVADGDCSDVLHVVTFPAP